MNEELMAAQKIKELSQAILGKISRGEDSSQLRSELLVIHRNSREKKTWLRLAVMPALAANDGALPALLGEDIVWADGILRSKH